MNYLVVGISGKIGSGKNYIGENVFIPELYRIAKSNNFQIIPYYFSFGDHLKVECLSRMPYNDLSKEHGYHGFFVEKTQDIRDKLQKYGTENGRNVYHQDVWVRAVDTWISIQLERLNKLKQNISDEMILPVFIISDIRFINEAEYVKSNNGILLRVNAPSRTLHRVQTEAKGIVEIMDKIMSHASETSLDNYNFEYTISNDDKTIEDIQSICKQIINKNLCWV